MPAETPTSLPDPRPGYWLEKAVSFDHESKKLVGVIVSQRYVGLNPRGDIPDWLVKIKGASGKILEVSFCDAYVTLK